MILLSEDLYIGSVLKRTYFCPKLFLNKRRGFVKLALQHGRELVPAFGFGENEVYDQLPNPEGSWVRWFQVTKSCITLGDCVKANLTRPHNVRHGSRGYLHSRCPSSTDAESFSIGAQGLNICSSVEYCFSFEFLNCISFGILPHRHPITVVVGRPVSVEKIPEPTPEQVGKVIEFKTYQ